MALQQQRGSPTTRSSVGSVTTLSNLLRMLYSRAGDYPKSQPLLYAESFSPNSAEGACPKCHGLGRVYDVTERSMVPDDTLTIRKRAVAAWPTAWHGQNLRDIPTTLGYDVDKPWRELSKKERNWILFTDEQPTVPVYAGYDAKEVRKAAEGGAELPGHVHGRPALRHGDVRQHDQRHDEEAVSQFMLSTECPACHGKRLKPEALSVKFVGMDIADMARVPLKQLAEMMRPYCGGTVGRQAAHPEKAIVVQRIVQDLSARLRTA